MATFGVIISNRSFFPDHLVLTAREKLLESMEAWGHKVITLSTDDTYMGETMTYDEAQKCAALFRAHAEEIDGIIVCLPNFGEETGVADAIRWSHLDCPVLIQACDDDFDKLQLENRRDAFCGKLSLCNNLWQYGIKYTLTGTAYLPCGRRGISRGCKPICQDLRCGKGHAHIAHCPDRRARHAISYSALFRKAAPAMRNHRGDGGFQRNHG